MLQVRLYAAGPSVRLYVAGPSVCRRFVCISQVRLYVAGPSVYRRSLTFIMLSSTSENQLEIKKKNNTICHLKL